MTRKKKLILSISSVLLMLILYGWFFGLQNCLALMVRWKLRAPVYGMVPQWLAVEAQSVPIIEVEAFDYQFSLPWADLAEVYSSGLIDAWTVSQSNITLVCFASVADAYQSIVDVNCWPEGTERSHQWFVNAIGLTDGIATNQFLYSQMWNTTTQNIHFFGSKSEAAVHFILLMGKAIMVPDDAPAGVYRFETDQVWGIQIGDPAYDQRVSLNMFDRLDREIKVVLASHADSDGAMTQADINTIITTLKVNP